MKKTKILLAVLMFVAIPESALYAQKIIESDSALIDTNIIPVSQITSRATELNSLILEKRSSRISTSDKIGLVSSIDTIVFRLNLMREDPRIQQVSSLNFRSIADLESDWSSLQLRLVDKQNQLSSMVDFIENDRTLLNQKKSIWENTQEATIESSAPQSVIEQIEATKGSIQIMMDSLGSDSEFLQDELVKISNGLIFCNTLLGELSAAQDQATRKIFEMNEPPIWNLFASKGDSTVFGSERSHLDDLSDEISQFGTVNSFRIIVHLILIILIFFSVSALYKNIKIPDREGKEIETIRKIIKRPISSSILIGFLATYLFYNSIPSILILINTIILLVPVILILSDLIQISSRRFIIIPLLALVLIQIHSLGYSESLFSRLFIISIIIFGLIYLALFYNTKLVKQLILNIRTRKVLYLYTILTFIFLFIAFVAAISGAVMLAEFLTYAIVKSSSLIIIIYALTITINSIIFTLIFGGSFHKINIVTQYSAIIYRKTSSSVSIISWILWIYFTLKLFTIWSEVSEFLKRIFTSDFNIGTIEISLGDLVLFVLILIITIWLSRLVKIIIEGEVAPRVKMKRGVPGAMALLLRIGIITVGFLFAASAAGFGMEKMTLLLGALGVGIGFGLQNIFNNLVSGVILAFERPIQEGDIIEVGEVWGTVKEIGIRASTIFTFDGAEVIVPNGNLISNELINWTLTDRNRRVELVIGVAYGTDPDKVIEILKDISSLHKDILNEPAPLALFSGFGESSLDFRLLFWIASADNRYLIQSEVNIAINAAIKDAGIEIPFPQRDLHLKSDDRDIKIK